MAVAWKVCGGAQFVADGVRSMNSWTSLARGQRVLHALDAMRLSFRRCRMTADQRADITHRLPNMPAVRFGDSWAISPTVGPLAINQFRLALTYISLR
ncbi:hypothetical protein SD37_17220 [Amycolatopsis orientalis]|uniref:Uncharacterized protein n=1 Tax=Amycolatopsis orientalis TaxID=31958 RepID=A0A193BYB0_AMYOR|nr:hypothetical protein SD37_17220 [Amycolatopsis orientalis]